MMKTIKMGIIFDMDGTLWDSTREVADVWSTVTLPKLGKQVTAEDMYRVMGMPMDQLALALFPDHELPELLPVMEESGRKENEYLAEHGACLYPNIIETVRRLAGEYPLYIVSNCQAGYIEAFLSYYQLADCFEDHICFGDNGRYKAENIACIIQRNKLERSVYVGDLQADYEAALAGGAEFIHAAYGFGAVHAQVPKIQAFSELPEVLKQLAAKYGAKPGV